MMDLSELRTSLTEAGISPAEYRIQESPDESTWCIRKQGKAWLVFYFERGTRWEEQRFNDEATACDYFYNRVTHG